MKITRPFFRVPSLLAVVRPTRLVPAGLFLCALLLAGGQPARAATIKLTNSAAGSYTWVCPASVTAVQVECWGAGGGGGGAKGLGGTFSAGGGGAGGAYARTNSYAVSAGTTYYLQVGAGGAGGVGSSSSPGGTGGDSWFSNAIPLATVVVAKGGPGGAGAASGIAAAGGTAPASTLSLGADAALAGGSGGAGMLNGASTAGGAGGSSAGPGGAGNTGANGSIVTTAAPAGGGTGGASQMGVGAGFAGGAPGGGGGGGGNNASANRAGGAGAAGRLILTYTIPFNSLSWIGDGANNRWSTNAGNIVWDSDANGTADLGFTDGDVVTFGLAGSNNPTVNLETRVVPTSLTINSASNYLFMGSGWISGGTSLAQSGAGRLTISTTNDYTGGTTIGAGRIRLANANVLGTGLVTLSGGALSADTSARMLTNAVKITIATTLGDPTDNGPLTLNGAVDFNGAGRTLTFSSDVMFANGATNGILASKLGNGTLTIKGIVNYSGASDVQNGTLIYDGATVVDSDRLIADAGAVAGIARLVITNGATVTVNTTVGNLRSGRVASTGSNYVDLAGLYSLPYADSANGNITLQANAAYSEMTFWPGGDFTARSVALNGAVTGTTVFKFNGGILRARNDNPNFLEGLSQTLVQAGGANLDDGGFAITINQNLLNGGGGLNKIGAGTLLLNGNNTYVGTTVVSNGNFGGSGTLSGPVHLLAGTTLVPGGTTNAIGTLTINNNLTLDPNSAVFMEINKSTPASDLVTGLNNVSYGGALTVTNISATPLAAGDTFQLFNASGTRSGGISSVTILPATGLWGSFNRTNGMLTIIQPPVGSDFYSVYADSTNNLFPVLTNDSGSGLTLVGVTAPLHGTAVISGTDILYSPAAGFAGTDVFTYTNQDGLSAQTALTVTVTVIIPPNYYDQYQVLRNSRSNRLDVLRNDPAGSTLVSVAQPTNGTTSSSGTNVIYTPNAGYFGPDSFTYVSHNSEGDVQSTATVDVRQYPNFVFILADDQGWTGLSVPMDTNRPNSKSDYFRTPNMEKFAAQSMRFSMGYSPHPNCSPSRYAILTGQTCARLKMTDIIGRSTTPVSGQFKLIAPAKAVDSIQAGKTTIAELLKSIPGAGYSAAHFGKWHLAGGGPVAHGFDADANDGATDNSQGNTGTFPIDPDPKRAYSVTDRALAYLDSRVTNGTAFYLQASHYAVHETTQTSQAAYDSYAGVPLGTWHTDRYYAAMTTDLDINVGRLLEKLDQLGIRNSTYVMYESDNGAPQSQSENFPLRGYKPEVWEGGDRVPVFVRGPGVPANSQCDVPVIGIDFLPTIWQWATGSTTNLPAEVDGGSLVPTISSIAQGSNAPTPIVRGGEFVHHSPHYVGPSPWPNDWQLNAKDMRPRSTIHDGHYKLVANYEPGTIELYDLNSDIGESTNLSPTQLAIKWQLWVRLRDYLKMVGAQMPTLDPTYPGTTNGAFVLKGATGALGDADSDGLPDDWEFRELLTYQFSGSDDPSQQGITLAQHYAQGTDPLIPNAYRINTITQIAPDQLQLTWNATPGASFVVETSTNLVDWVPAHTVTAGDVFMGSVVVERTRPEEFFRVRKL